MATIHTVFGHIVKKEMTIFIDECGPVRHRLAQLGLCEHKGYDMPFTEWIDKEVQEAYDACHPYPRIFNIQRDDA